MPSAPPLIIPIFITHQGCPHRCLFCNQRPITGSNGQTATSEAWVAAEIRTWLARSPPGHRQVQVAFYGGSFTGLAEDHQRRLLLAVQPFLRAGLVHGIRLSTRPDYIHPHTPRFLRDLGVDTVELGVQSLHGETLQHSLRGHNAEQTATAMATLQAAGLRTGAQLMLGLPRETTLTTLRGAQRLADLGPDFARLHPTLVLRGSGLEQLYHHGSYRPLSLARAVVLAGRVSGLLEGRGIPVIRIGLQPSPELEASLVAGPHHPAFGELVKRWLLFQELRRLLLPLGGQACRLTLAAQDRSLVHGHHGALLTRLRRRGLLLKTSLVFSQGEVARGTARVEILSPQATAET